MQKKKYRFSQKTTTYYFNAGIADLKKLTDQENTVIITDRNIYDRHADKFAGWKVIVLEPGEEHKVQSAIDHILQQLIAYNTDRGSFLLGIGGGVVTDLTGFAASVYMRGIRFGFMPVSILAMVDAAIGGKNGIDVGVYKNLAGTINQPEFLLYDPAFLKTLPENEWINGFAEIIKHACIKDAGLFRELEKNTLNSYRTNQKLLSRLIRINAEIKSDVVLEDEFEKNERRLLNFGHTWGHAVEKKLMLPHGHAVAIGMVVACRISEKLNGFKDTKRVTALLERYGLPTSAETDRKAVMEVLLMDKKKEKAVMNYILLQRLGKAVIKPIPVEKLKKIIEDLNI